MDWQSLIAIGAFAVAAFSLLTRMVDRSLSIREHEEYKSQENQKAALRQRFEDERARLIEKVYDQNHRTMLRNIRRVQKQLIVLEKTRPSAETLGTITDNFEKRLDRIEKSRRKP